MEKKEGRMYIVI